MERLRSCLAVVGAGVLAGLLAVAASAVDGGPAGQPAPAALVASGHDDGFSWG